jgi:deoxyadenosine/deoxycytidine kinase
MIMDDEWDGEERAESPLPSVRAESCMNLFRGQVAKKARDMQKLLSVKRVFLEGNIGSGKSTVLAALKLNAHIDCVPEPVQKWSCLRYSSQGGTVNLLQRAYDFPLTDAFELQVHINNTMIEAHETPLQKEGAKARVMERSLFSSNIFIDLSYMSPSQRTVAKQMIEPYYELPHFQPDLIVHLQADPETCLERIQKRKRPGEDKVNLDYLENLNSKMTDWMDKIMTGTAHPKGCAKIINVDGNEQMDEVIRQVYYHVYNEARLPGPHPFADF